MAIGVHNDDPQDFGGQRNDVVERCFAGRSQVEFLPALDVLLGEETYCILYST